MQFLTVANVRVWLSPCLSRVLLKEHRYIIRSHRLRDATEAFVTAGGLGEKVNKEDLKIASTVRFEGMAQGSGKRNMSHNF